MTFDLDQISDAIERSRSANPLDQIPPDQNVDQALAALAGSAIDTLKNVMEGVKTAPKDKIAAANSILDRLGYGRTTRVQAEVADKEIERAIENAKRLATKQREQEARQAREVTPVTHVMAVDPIKTKLDDAEETSQ